MPRIVMCTISVFICMCCCICFSREKALCYADPVSYAVALEPTPVFNIPDISRIFGGSDGKTLHRDDSGLIREVEFIALPGTVFTVKEVIKGPCADVYRVTSGDYPYPSKNGYYVDSRFVRAMGHKPEDREKKLPSEEEILGRLMSSEGSIYIWGGNSRAGVKELLAYYPPCDEIGRELKDIWMLKGLDCSGLLYEATDGYTPRNTSALVVYGEAVKIKGRSIDRIIRKLEPLDLIVWKGHVIIVLDNDHVIESRVKYGGQTGGGVRIRDIKEVLTGLLKERSPADVYDERMSGKQFVVRRWYGVS